MTAGALHEAVAEISRKREVLLVACPDQSAAAAYLPYLAQLADRLQVDLTVQLQPSGDGTQLHVTGRRQSERPWRFWRRRRPA